MTNSDSPSSRECPNCGKPLTGRYCANCGQEDHSLAVPLYRLILDFLSDQFQFDARVWRTLGLLLFRPGHLTRTYLAGKRQSHIPPVRLYLFVTIIFFLTVGFLPLGGVHFNVRMPTGKQLVAPGAATHAGGAPAVGSAVAPLTSTTDIGKLIMQQIAKSQRTKTPSAASVNASARKYLLPRIKALQDNPQQFWKRFWSNMPKVLFFLIPVFALLLKLLYLLRKRYYSEHLIFALHYHSALFIYLLVVVLLILLSKIASPLWGSVLRWCCLILGTWSVVYAFPAMRTAYADTWPRAVWRGLALWFMYSIALFTGTLVAMSIAFAVS